MKRVFSARHNRRLVEKLTNEELLEIHCHNEVVNINQLFSYDENPPPETTVDLTTVHNTASHSTALSESSAFNFPIALNDYDEDIEPPVLTDFPVKKPTLFGKLSDWAVTNNINQNAVSKLLMILRDPCWNSFEFQLLPKDCRTLLKTPRSTNVMKLGSGSYCHFGLNNALKKIVAERAKKKINSDNVNLLINIDGLPLSRSSTAALWPILVSDMEIDRVFIVGAYYGTQKPQSSDEYLKLFVEEMIEVVTNDFEAADGSHTVAVRLEALVCDAPAKSFVLNVKGHGGYNSCSKCTISGEYVNNRICFPYQDNRLSTLSLRSDELFINGAYEDDFQLGQTVLSKIPYFGPVSNVPLDYMHLICLGVTRKLLLLWINGRPLNIRIAARNVNEISKMLVSLKTSTPKEFSRKPRGLNEVNNWKATEFRTFLLYTGPIVMKQFLKRDAYLHFLTLHIAVRILSCPLLIESESNLKYANDLLVHFVKSFEMIYGKDKISHNVHNLLHIVDDVKKFGCLDKFSAFKFENYMSTIKKILRKSEKPLQQLSKRYAEIERNSCYSEYEYEADILSKEHNEGPLLHGNSLTVRQYKLCTRKNFTIQCRDCKNNCFLLKDDTPVIIENILNEGNVISVIGKKMTRLGDVFFSPCSSSALLGVVYATLDDNCLFSWNISDIKCKNQAAFTVLEFEDGVCLVPSTWLYKNNKMCYYPPYTSQIMINKSIASKSSPDKTWLHCKVVRIFCTAVNYIKGMDKLKLAETISEVDTDNNDVSTRHIRHQKMAAYASDDDNTHSSFRRRQNHTLSSSEEDENEQCSLVPFPRHSSQNLVSTVTIASEVKDPKAEMNKQKSLLSQKTHISKKTSSRESIETASLGTETIISSSSSHCSCGSSSDFEFKRLILKKLNMIVEKLNVMEKNIESMANNKMSANDIDQFEYKDMQRMLPLNTVDDLIGFDDSLASEEGFFKKMVSILKGIGGSDLHNVTVGILKRLLKNVVAVEYSLCGKKKKRTFKDLHTCRLIIDTARTHIPSATEQQVTNIIAAWLTQSSLRLSRETKKNAN